jgi:hypothetical protein
MLEDIKKSLLDAGHDKNAIEIAVLELEKHNYEEFNYDKINNDTERELIEAIEVFIEDRLKHGISIEKIKKVLKDYGHAETLIEKALRNVKTRPIKIAKHKIFPRTGTLEKEHVLLTGIISVILLVAMSAAVVDENIFLVFLGFIPTTITILIGYYYAERLREKIFITPFITSGLFFLAGMTASPIKNMEYGSLSIFNLILSFVIVLLFNQLEMEKEEKEDLIRKNVDLKKNLKDIKETTEEDKDSGEKYTEKTKNMEAGDKKESKEKKSRKKAKE